MNARSFSDKINVTLLSQHIAIFTAPSARICVSLALTLPSFASRFHQNTY